MDFYITFGLTLGAFSLVTAWMFISSRVPVWVRALAAAIAAVLALLLWTQAIMLVGLPLPGVPPDNSTIIDFLVEDTVVYLWVLDRDGHTPRSYKLPDHDHRKSKALHEARGVGLRPTQKLVYHETRDSIVDVVSALPPKNPGGDY